MAEQLMTPYLTQWLATLEPEGLAELLARRPDTLGIPPADLTELAERLGARQSVDLALRSLNRTQADVLAACVGLPSITLDAALGRFVPETDPELVEQSLADLCRLGLMWPIGDGGYALVPALRVTGGRSSRPMQLHVQPPPPTVDPADADAANAAAGVVALGVVRAVTGLIEFCSTAPPATLRNGGVGVKEIRRVAAALRVSESNARLWLSLAYHADLLDSDDGEILPTRGADEWLADSPADRLVPLLMTWWRLPAAPTAPDPGGKAAAALSHAYRDTDRDLRHDLIGWFGRQPVGSVLADRDALLDALAWAKPQVYRDLGVATAVLDEAEALGVLVRGGLTAWGRALVSGSEFALADAVDRWLPQATSTVRLQADLTAVVTGMPTVELSELLDLAADPGERDMASTWRFSPTSVRRALDTGVSAQRLLESLRTASDDEVPQPLEYLVLDVARRHGELTVREVGCCISATDTALLAEVAAHRDLGALRLRLLAPGVLASALSAEKTLEALRANGYAPSAMDGGGMPVLARTRPKRARERVRIISRPQANWPVLGPDSPDDLVELAQELLATPVDPSSGAASLVRQHGKHLSEDEIALLSDAIETETAIEITYSDQNDRTSRRVITPLELIGGMVDAWCHLRDDERRFLISGIRRVAAPEV